MTPGTPSRPCWRASPSQWKRPSFGCSTKWSEKRESAKRSLEPWAKEEVRLKLIDKKGIRALVKNDGRSFALSTSGPPGAAPAWRNCPSS